LKGGERERKKTGEKSSSSSSSGSRESLEVEEVVGDEKTCSFSFLLSCSNNKVFPFSFSFAFFLSEKKNKSRSGKLSLLF